MLESTKAGEKDCLLVICIRSVRKEVQNRKISNVIQSKSIVYFIFSTVKI